MSLNQGGTSRGGYILAELNSADPGRELMCLFWDVGKVCPEEEDVYCASSRVFYMIEFLKCETQDTGNSRTCTKRGWWPTSSL